MAEKIIVRGPEGNQTNDILWKAIDSRMADIDGLDPRLPPGFLDDYAKLSPKQAGHIRHFHNMATLEDGNWGVMGSQVSGQEWLDAYRYQLATMAYASGAAHYHRMPALRSAFKALFEQLIHKMLQQEVWSYWYLTSQSGRFVDPDIEELRKPWPDPIAKENIMYSGHLLLMISLYAMLFNDDRYDQPDALVFNWNPIFWGMGPAHFSYTTKSLQKAILDEMEAENWLGVCCEPNSIFVICNQFPLIAMRYNDVRDDTNIVEEVIPKYVAAWKEKGMVQENGLFVNWYMPKQGKMVNSPDIGNTAWATAFMNAWNPTVAKRTFETQAVGFLSKTEAGTISPNPGPVAFAIRSIAKKEGIDPFSSEARRKAREWLAQNPANVPSLPFPRPMYGYVLKGVSEVGDQATLDGLLAHADQFTQPVWDRGGLYYALSAHKENSEGNWTEMERFTGNGAIGYARLNVFDGQRKMWTDPWTPKHVSEAPFVDGFDFSSGIDFLRCRWDDLRGAFIMTMRTWDGSSKRVKLTVVNLPTGRYGLYLDSTLAGVLDVERPRSNFELSVEVTGNESDVVLKSTMDCP